MYGVLSRSGSRLPADDLPPRRIASVAKQDVVACIASFFSSLTRHVPVPLRRPAVRSARRLTTQSASCSQEQVPGGSARYWCTCGSRWSWSTRFWSSEQGLVGLAGASAIGPSSARVETRLGDGEHNLGVVRNTCLSITAPACPT